MIRIALAAAVLLSLLAPAGADAFGRNKVQYDTFQWRVLATDHLEVHFHAEEEALARRAADYGEAACRALDRDLGHTLSRKIPVIVYGSHYRFRQNNVTASLVGESTGGFTEIFRTRVALPYSGSEEDFRHVIHHELVHAYVFDRLYGGPVKSFFVLQYAFYIPLWFMEGIAEYYSNTWDTESEMMLRDAAVTGALPPFDRIHGGYFVYKSGWSAVGYLVDRHGEGVIRDIIDKLDETRDLRTAVQEVTGEDLATISGDWLHDVRRRTWPTIASLEGPDDFGRLLTHHGPAEGILNGNPALAPDGRRVAFLSNRSGTPDLWVQDIADSTEPVRPPRVLLRGARGGKFESLHPLRSSVGWSPDGRYLVAAAQKGARDALYVVDVERGKEIAELVPDLDAVERPDWSPVDARFVFTGLRNGQVDLWTLDADGTRLHRLTDDLAREEAPAFSPDGRRVAFSRRGEAGAPDADLWVLDLDSGDARPLIAASGDQWNPAWSPDGWSVYYVSDEHGTRDLMRLDLRHGSATRLTALVGGADSPSTARQGDRLAYTAFHDGGWDVVLIEEASALTPHEAPDVTFPDIPWAGHTPSEPSATDSAATRLADADADADADAGIAADAQDVADATADPVVTGYRPRFRSEWITGAFFYDGFGPSAALSTSISDVLGNHRVTVGANLFRNLENTDASLLYSYLARRIDWSLGAFHAKDYFLDDRTSLGQPIGEEGEDSFFSERRWGLRAAASYPFHTFRRIGVELTALEVEREILDRAAPGDPTPRVTRGQLLLPRVHHSFDNTLWGWTGPVQGTRSVLSFQHSVPLGGERLSFGTVIGDWRRYWRFTGDYVVAVRGFGAWSFGSEPQQFQIGGPNTVRGYSRQQFHGTHAAVASVEFRYPFLEYVRFGWPFRSAFGGIRGDLFLDVGAAFDDPDHFRAVGRPAAGRAGLQDLRTGFGVGARARVAYLPLRVDVGWPTTLREVGKPVWHFTISPEF